MIKMKFTLWLMLILIVPFLLREKWGHNGEIFPAVMLPTGAIKVPVNPEERVIKDISLYGQKKSGEWEKIDTKTLLAPIPTQYHKPIILQAFGLKKNSIDTLRSSGLIGKLKKRLKPRNANTEDIIAVKRWLRDWLITEEFESSAVKVVQTTRRGKTAGHLSDLKNNSYESIINLD